MCACANASRSDIRLNFMIKIFRYMKKYTLLIALIIVLLAVQAFFDLSLPDYTAKIVNVGIMQNGIESAVPKAIRQTELDKVLHFMLEDDRETVQQFYTLYEKQEPGIAKIDDYPLLATEPLYLLDKITDEEEATLARLLAEPLLIRSFLAKDVEEQGFALAPALGDILAEMPQSQRLQAAVAVVHDEYQAIGMDMRSIQTLYILITGLQMLGMTLASVLVAVVVTLFSAQVAAGTGKLLRSEVFNRVMSFSGSDLDSFGTASLITRSTNDI